MSKLGYLESHSSEFRFVGFSVSAWSVCFLVFIQQHPLAAGCSQYLRLSQRTSSSSIYERQSECDHSYHFSALRQRQWGKKKEKCISRLTPSRSRCHAREPGNLRGQWGPGSQYSIYLQSLFTGNRAIASKGTVFICLLGRCCFHVQFIKQKKQSFCEFTGPVISFLVHLPGNHGVCYSVREQIKGDNSHSFSLS